MTMACCRDRPIQTSKKKVTPMGNAYEIYALRYATMSPRTPHLNFLSPDPHETTAQDLDYFVWLIRGQDREMSYATGRCMCHGVLRHPFSVEHVTLMVRHVFSERVSFHSGDGEVAPGVTLHRVGGHSDGLQVVRVETARGPRSEERRVGKECRS